MAETITQIIQLRRGLFSSASQEQYPDLEVIPSDYILEAGEGCYEVDTQRLKIGDGIKEYSELDYIGAKDPAIVVDWKSIDFTNSTIQMHGFTNASIGYIPYKQEDGTLGWKVDKDTDLTPRVEALENWTISATSRFNAIESTISSLSDDLNVVKSTVNNLSERMNVVENTISNNVFLNTNVIEIFGGNANGWEEA